MADRFKLELINTLRNMRLFEKLLTRLEIHRLENGECLAEMRIEEMHANTLGGLHGGMSATLVDSVSTFALNTHPMVGFKTPTVSVDLHISYLKGAKVHSIIEIYARTIRAGRTYGFLEATIRDKLTRAVLVKGSHTKFIFPKGTKMMPQEKRPRE